MKEFDIKMIALANSVFVPLARIALFVIFFYFGLLKVLGLSPADPLVSALLSVTLPLFSFEGFSIFLGFFEMLIGVLFLIPNGRATRVAFVLLVLQMGTTFLPLVFLPYLTWYSAGVPTLEGQYIIKNIVIVALAVGLISQLKPQKIKK